MPKEGVEKRKMIVERSRSTKVHPRIRPGSRARKLPEQDLSILPFLEILPPAPPCLSCSHMCDRREIETKSTHIAFTVHGVMFLFGSHSGCNPSRARKFPEATPHVSKRTARLGIMARPDNPGEA